MIDAIMYLDSLTFPVIDTDVLMMSVFLFTMLALTGIVLLAEKIYKRLK